MRGVQAWRVLGEKGEAEGDMKGLGELRRGWREVGGLCSVGFGGYRGIGGLRKGL